MKINPIASQARVGDIYIISDNVKRTERKITEIGTANSPAFRKVFLCRYKERIVPHNETKEVKYSIKKTFCRLDSMKRWADRNSKNPTSKPSFSRPPHSFAVFPTVVLEDGELPMLIELLEIIAGVIKLERKITPTERPIYINTPMIRSHIRTRSDGEFDIKLFLK